MAIELKFTFELDKHIGFPPPSIRLWVDTDKNLQLSSAEEVRMTKAGLQWTGNFKLKADTTEGFQFFAAYVASVGARWKLTVQSDTPSAHVVCEGHGTVHIGRDAFWGELSK